MSTERKQYLTDLADDYDIDIYTVLAIANMLGPNEDYDGLVTMLDDLSIQASLCT